MCIRDRWMAYPHKCSPISYKSSAGQRKHIGQRPMFYHWTTQPHREGGAGSSSNTKSPGPRSTSTINMGWKKIGRAPPPFWGGVAGPYLIQSGLGRGLAPYQVVSWSMQPFGCNRYGLKIGGVPLWGRGAGSRSNTMWPGLRPTCTPSFILIRPTVWPQCTNVTDREKDRTGQTGQRSDSIGRTVLQTVAQKRRLLKQKLSVRSDLVFYTVSTIRTKQ